MRKKRVKGRGELPRTFYLQKDFHQERNRKKVEDRRKG